MQKNFPELTTIGALFRFAAVLETAALEALEAATGKVTNDDDKAKLARLVKKRQRRADELERARREKLNETVLEPLMDMPGDPYIPELPDDVADLSVDKLIALCLEIEKHSISFYGASIDKAGPVLAENKRLFARFQKESGKNEKALSALSL